MGAITGLATIATVLTLVMVVSALLVVGLGLAVVLPAARDSRQRRRQHEVTIPAWYLRAAGAH
jgi:hypothetical protein